MISGVSFSYSSGCPSCLGAFERQASDARKDQKGKDLAPRPASPCKNKPKELLAKERAAADRPSGKAEVQHAAEAVTQPGAGQATDPPTKRVEQVRRTAAAAAASLEATNAGEQAAVRSAAEISQHKQARQKAKE